MSLGLYLFYRQHFYSYFILRWSLIHSTNTWLLPEHCIILGSGDNSNNSEQARSLKPGELIMCPPLLGTYDTLWQLLFWPSFSDCAFQLCILIFHYSNWPILWVLHKCGLTKLTNKITGSHLSPPGWDQIMSEVPKSKDTKSKSSCRDRKQKASQPKSKRKMRWDRSL